MKNFNVTEIVSLKGVKKPSDLWSGIAPETTHIYHVTGERKPYLSFLSRRETQLIAKFLEGRTSGALYKEREGWAAETDAVKGTKVLVRALSDCWDLVRNLPQEVFSGLGVDDLFDLMYFFSDSITFMEESQEMQAMIRERLSRESLSELYRMKESRHLPWSNTNLGSDLVSGAIQELERRAAQEVKDRVL